MKVMVTGATGFLGKALALKLKAEGHTVTALGRNTAVGEQLKRAGLRFVQADLTDAEAMVKACEGQDWVFHSGALSSPWGTPDAFYAANVFGTENVVLGCRAHGVKRLIHVSTPSIYFDFTDREDIPEDLPLPARAANDYARTKRLAEDVVDRAFRAGMEVVTVRPRALFGPEDQTIFPRLIEANARGALPVVGGADPLIDITYIDNVVDALLLCATASNAALGRKFNITNGEPVRLQTTLKEVLTALDMPYRPKRLSYFGAMAAASLLELRARLWPSTGEPLITRYTAGVLAKTQTLDITAAREVLGYVPRVSVAEGIQRYITWYKAQQEALHGG